MKRLRFALVMGLLTSPGLAQTSEPNPQTQQQILEELRAIHRDMQTSTSLQLLLAELQITQTSLDHAIQKRDALRYRSRSYGLKRQLLKKRLTDSEAGWRR